MTSTRLHCATARQANEELMLVLIIVIESEVRGVPPTREPPLLKLRRA
jgi:hypothetical protein